MKIEQKLWDKGIWHHRFGDATPEANLVLYFGATDLVEKPDLRAHLKKEYPKAILMGCSTGAEIAGDEVLENTLIATAIHFKHTRLKGAAVINAAIEDSESSGKKLGAVLKAPDLKAIFLLSDGLIVNGTALVNGLTSVVGSKVTITGGLAGDATRFQKTFAGYGDEVHQHQIVALGFYGDKIHVGHGNMGGWHPFGPERAITKAKGSVLYELDGQPALDLYKKYLGDEAKNLPGSALLFPLNVRPKDEKNKYLVRTVLAVDEKEKSMTFAGDIPQGHVAQLMSANFDLMVSSAGDSAQHAIKDLPSKEGFAILISCIGRKLVLGPRTSDETEEADNILGPKIAKSGFYSYGEISPHIITQTCELHNQTMTITVYVEQD